METGLYLYRTGLCRGIGLIFAVVLVVAPAVAQERLLIGGGSQTGIYFQAARRICEVLNDTLLGHFQCLGRPTLGSVFNINAVDRRLLDFGIAQSDRNWQAAHGEREWANRGPMQNLRSVFSLHLEPVFLVTRRDAQILSVDDLKGKRVNIGNPGSGQRGNAEDVLRLYGIDENTDIQAEGLQQHEASRALIDGKLDAFFYTVGQHSAAIDETARAVAVRFVPIDSPGVKSWVAEKSYYLMTTVPANTYPGMDEPIETFAVKATVVTSAEQSDELVYILVSAVFENLDRIRASHPAFAALEPAAMLEGLSAPLHRGAERYYRETGLLPGER